MVNESSSIANILPTHDYAQVTKFDKPKLIAGITTFDDSCGNSIVVDIDMNQEDNSERSTEEQEERPVATRTRRLSRTINLGANTIDSPLSGFRGDDSSMTKADELSDQSNQAVTVDDIVSILQKDESERTDGDRRMLEEWPFLVPSAKARIKAKLARKILKQRAIEQEESIESIEEKVATLADLIEEANSVVMYTGAGISTSASIPDYRGPNGLWTQIKRKGHFSLTKFNDLSAAEPTLTHMAIKELCRRRIVSHVVSQNCDGLHLRSGIPQTQLSEIHGNMFIEVCPACEKQYFRQADVTDKTSRFRHKTGRKCHTCAEPNNNLIDTIVLFGERSRTNWPMNWERASKAAKNANLIICMGSSLKVLARYHCLWPKRNRKFSNKEPETKLVIINLQYTPKDESAVLKIRGKCDLVMKLLMQRLNIEVPEYDWSKDPLLNLAIPFTPEERVSLKRNLIFEAKAKQALSLKRSLSTSPSLFVSEITDDPDNKKLKMRIRAVNAEDAEASTSQQDIKPKLEVNSEDVPAPPELAATFALPGWLGKSIGRRTSYYKRKRRRHHNHASKDKSQEQT